LTFYAKIIGIERYFFQCRRGKSRSDEQNKEVYIGKNKNICTVRIFSQRAYQVRIQKQVYQQNRTLQKSHKEVIFNDFRIVFP
jgi:hypothetical protein